MCLMLVMLMADCVHKCHQRFELSVRTKEDKNKVVNGKFPKLG